MGVLLNWDLIRPDLNLQTTTRYMWDPGMLSPDKEVFRKVDIRNS